MRLGLFRAIAVAASVAAGAVSAQQADDPLTQATIPQFAVVVLDRDALFSQSMFGIRVTNDIELASTDLSAENRRIEAELETEERALTQQREMMGNDEFRSLASDFDARVVGIRRAQDAKARAIQQQSERAQAVFFEKANPVLVALAREVGALVILDRRIVIASADQVDITMLALERIDASLGDGEALTQPDAPLRRPDALLQMAPGTATSLD